MLLSTATFPFNFSILLARSFFFIALISSNDSCTFSHYDKPSSRRGVKDLTRASVKKRVLTLQMFAELKTKPKQCMVVEKIITEKIT